MEKRKIRWQLLFLLILFIGTVFILRKHNTPKTFQKNTGRIFGTVFHATYESDTDLQEDIIAELMKVDFSLSPFNEESIISKINRNEEVIPDSLFLETFFCAQEVSRKTNGAFDITIAPLANVWGFGFKQKMPIDSQIVDSLLKITGYEKVSYQDGKIIKEDERIMLSASAIAKGYGSDVVGRYFDSKGIKNYMIEIGGEVVVKGTNPKNENWRIAINKPIEDDFSTNTQLQAILSLTNVGMATSGNYRNYYYEDGKRIGHTIDPRTGYPIQQTLLSTTVIAKNCLIADAYSTAFMVMGFEASRDFVEAEEELDAFFVYCDEEGNSHVWFTEGMKKYIVEIDEEDGTSFL